MRVYDKTGQYADGILGASPPANECVDVLYQIGITNRNRFTFLVDSYSDVPQQLTATVQLAPTVYDGQTVYLDVLTTAGPGRACVWSETDPGGQLPVTITPNPADASGCSASFIAPTGLTNPATLEFTATVTDSTGQINAVGTTTVQPDAINVDAGNDRTGSPGQTLSLHAQGSGSGPSPSYSWTQLSPGTPQPPLTAGNTDNPSFTVPAVTAPTTLVFQVTFSDGLKTATDTVAVNILPPQTASPNAPLTIVSATQQAPPGGTTQKLADLVSGGDGHYTWDWKETIPSSAH